MLRNDSATNVNVQSKTRIPRTGHFAIATQECVVTRTPLALSAHSFEARTVRIALLNFVGISNESCVDI